MLMNFIKGQISARIAYPFAERQEKRLIRTKLKELKRYYQLPFSERKKIIHQQLINIIQFAEKEVPYYRDLFRAISFDTNKLAQDIRYLQDIPYLTKNIIREQGARLLSTSLEKMRFHERKTGGSTGLPCVIYYDQTALDYSAAVVLFARNSIGKKHHMPELHFANRFPERFPLRARLREQIKCFSMNRTNLFFDALDESSLNIIWQTLRSRKPYLIHAHPSTIYALACYIERKQGQIKKPPFQIFESSGELLASYMREKISRVLGCKIIDRYGLAEFGVIAYETQAPPNTLLVLDSEGFIENDPEITFTGFRNRLMPLIRYQTGDLGSLTETANGWELSNMVGRIHDMVPIENKIYPTHYIQDVLDRVGGIQEFQIDLRCNPPKLMLVAEPTTKPEDILPKLREWWSTGMEIVFVAQHELVRVGRHAKFRHVVQP